MQNKQLFIKTTDKETAGTLLSLGFKLVSHDITTWTFLNESKSLNFDNVEKSKIAFSDVLSI